MKRTSALRGNRREKTWRSSQSTKQNYRSFNEAVILAAQQVGEDNRGRDGLLGYLRRIARTEPKLFAALLGRVPPGQIIDKEDRKVRYETYEEAREALLEEGVDVDRLEPLFAEEGLCSVSRLLPIAGAWEHVPAGSWTHVARDEHAVPGSAAIAFAI
jgi:hypothetical protein